MRERPQNFEEVGDDSEVTLATPRFDADAARHAHPVVPLEEIHAGRRPAHFRGGARRWPLSLIVVALLAVIAFGGIVALRRAHTNTPAPATQEQQPAQTDTTPAQTVAPPAQTDASAQPQTAPAPTAAAEEKTGEEKAANEEKSEGRAPLRAREERAARARRDEQILPPPAAERGDVAGEDGEHRGHFKGDGRRGEGMDEKEAKKASKHQNKGGARLVDVLVGRPRP